MSRHIAAERLLVLCLRVNNAKIHTKDKSKAMKSFISSAKAGPAKTEASHIKPKQ